MSRIYEGLFIFPETLDEEGLDKAIEAVNNELVNLGGSLDSSVRMGKRQFARMMKKQKSGYYVVLVFSLETEKITKFKERLKLGTDVFRYQFKGVNRTDLVSETANEV